MKSKHTPGPWEVDRYYWTLQRRLFGDDEPEVQIIGRISETEDDEREANARLIAAAPELLAELIAIAKKVDESRDAYELAADMVASNPKLKDLIRKATQP